MNATAKTQLIQGLQLPGVAAWCVCTPERAYEHHCYTDWFKPAQLEAIVAKLAQAMEGLRRHDVAPVQACWDFEHARLLLTQRADGTVLGVFIENRPELDLSPHRAELRAFAAGA